MILAMLDAAEADAFVEISKYMAWAGANSAIATEVAETVWGILTKHYNMSLSKPQFVAEMKAQVETLYKDMAAPRVNFTLFDTRAMVYLENSDKVYLGKFITDPKIKANVVAFIKEAYIENGRAIGNSPTELRAFLEAFKDQLQLERWQARRIIDTTVSRARVFGKVIGFRQAAGKTFQISGPRDNLTCTFCWEMVDRKFSVATALSDMEVLFNKGPEGVDMVLPFLKGSASIDELKSASSEDLEAAGLYLPPYHPHCRHFPTLVDSYEDPTQIPYSIE